jgi:hypothetical protein
MNPHPDPEAGGVMTRRERLIETSIRLRDVLSELEKARRDYEEALSLVDDEQRLIGHVLMNLTALRPEA